MLQEFAGTELLSLFDDCFNSLFEMPALMPAPIRAAADLSSFNSLFEMRRGAPPAQAANPEFQFSV